MDAKGVQTRLSENIRKIRKEKGLTQFALAEKANVSEATIKSVELCLNWPSEKTIAQIANALEIDIAKLFLPQANAIDAQTLSQQGIKQIIADNLRLYVDSVLREIVS